MKWFFIVPFTVLIAAAQPPVFNEPFSIYADGVPVEVYYSPAVCFSDWDGDGLQDLMVGHCNSGMGGTIDLYLNSGFPDSPVFTYSTIMQADGSDIVLPAGG
jgi:hypothetical protein